MQWIRITLDHFEALKPLQLAYKAEIGEDPPDTEAFCRLRQAIHQEQITFFGCLQEGQLVACCSVSPTFSTFNYAPSGVFEDFYILPAWRHRGIARQLAAFAYAESGVQSLTVGCAACDLALYQAIGFRLPLGHLLAYSPD